MVRYLCEEMFPRQAMKREHFAKDIIIELNSSDVWLILINVDPFLPQNDKKKGFIK